ncbi:MAG: HAMP domain-containing sensor histidine kinase [Actinomycetota bacterium]|nr:HAMP domain-containing sensor histidine kinase [Actinomycetota bacterium]MDP3630496.1 HAMP domain-containing sensor histidine kinase [Actinomycetota bacterium]
MRRSRLIWQVFLSILVVSLTSIFATGIIARAALSSAFEAYLVAAPTHMGAVQGHGMGRVFIGVAEQTFMSGVDRGIVLSAIVAVGFAAVAALFLARYLTRPLGQLTAGAKAVAAGNLDHRVEVAGPGEVEDLADAFNEMASSLQAGEDLRRRMVSDVAHELRNPVAALRAQAEAVAEGILPMDEHRIASIVEDLAHLSRVIEDLQELSTAESGGVRYNREQFDMCELARREVERGSLMTGGGVSMDVACDGRALLVEADAFRIAQVLRNLLGNAARHTQEGSITVRVERIECWIRVAVEDTGEGIAAADLPHIFERFYRADTARATSTGGTGLGLAISKHVIEDQGGAVFAASTEGVGSIIGFSLPMCAETITTV